MESVASASTVVKEQSEGDRTSGTKKNFYGRRSLPIVNFESNKSPNIFIDSPEASDEFPGEHCVQFITLLPHQEKLFYLNLFRRKKQYSSNPISHIEHRTKSHVCMEISAFDSPVCRVRIFAKEKRNIERVLELFDEYCPVLLKYSNHQELSKIRQSLQRDGSSTFSGDIRQSFTNKLPTLRRATSTRQKESLSDKGKAGKSKTTKILTKAEKKVEDKKSSESISDPSPSDSNVVQDPRGEDLKVDNAKSSVSPNESDFEREKTLSFDGDVMNNETSLISAVESVVKSDRDAPPRPSFTLPKHRSSEHRKSATSVEICKELEHVVEDYLEREREKVEKQKMEAKSEQTALEKFRALVRGNKPPRKPRKEKPLEGIGDKSDAMSRLKKFEMANATGEAKKRRARKKRSMIQTSSNGRRSSSRINK